MDSKNPDYRSARPRWRNGRRARFRCECREACRFDSCSGHPIKSQVVENQLLAIFAFRNCQRNVSESRKSQLFNPAEPQQIQLNKPNLSLLTFFNTPYGSGIVFLSLDFILSTDFSIVSPSHHNKARQRFSFR